VNPIDRMPDDIKKKDRLFHIQSNFNDFIIKLLEVFQIKEPTIHKEIEKILKGLDPNVLYPDFDTISEIVNKCSTASLLRVEKNVQKISKNDKVIRLIQRKEARREITRFIKNQTPLMALVGDSGTGKSIILYCLAKEKKEDFVTLFYTAKHLNESLKMQLSNDLRCELNQFESVTEHFNKILLEQRKKLLIVVDGINESDHILPSNLKNEIESIGTLLPESIKILYSCRTVFWNAYVRADEAIETEVYSLSRIYLEDEARLAFEAYQEVFNFKGTYNSLEKDFKHTIDSPFMLRMMAEGYEGEPLPKFAPAVKIFGNYEKYLDEKFKEKVYLFDFIRKIVANKLKEIDTQDPISDQFSARKIRTNHEFSYFFDQAKPKDPFVLLDDEGVLSLIDPKESIYRFTYERFFEYLLGKEIGDQFKIEINKKKKGSIENRFVEVISKWILRLKGIHFTFTQALKSEIIRQNIIAPDDYWSLSNLKTLKLLLNCRDTSIVNFTKEILRELTFESDYDLLGCLKGVVKNDIEFKLLALEIAWDSPKVKAILKNGIFATNTDLSRHCIDALSEMLKDDALRFDFENFVFQRIESITEIDSSFIRGIIYFASAIFSANNKIGNDPFFETSIVLEKCISGIFKKSNIAYLKSILVSEFTEIVKKEGPLFFSSDSTSQGMEYIWTGMSNEVQSAALKMSSLLLEPNTVVDDELKDIVKFFGSEIKNWELRNDPGSSSISTYRIEYRIAQWIIILMSKENYDEAKSILEYFVDSGFWLSIDFALCTMQFIIQDVHNSSEEILEDGYKTMKKWTERFETENENFFDILEKENPLLDSFCPYAQVCNVEADRPSSKSSNTIGFLNERLKSNDIRKVLVALLSIRLIWKRHPQKCLNSLWYTINSENSKVKEWSEVLIKKIYTVYPQLVEDFFLYNRMDHHQKESIKFGHKETELRDVMYDSLPIFKSLLFHSKKRRKYFIDWYRKLFDYKDINEYSSELVEFLLKTILS